MSNHIDLGKEGENEAIKYLKKIGYQILHTNWRSGSYELDIVAQRGEELIIAEVKTRSENSLISPEEAVDNRKIKNIISATNRYIEMFDVDLPVRFDVISVIGNAPNFAIEHIEDAFYPPMTTY